MCLVLRSQRYIACSRQTDLPVSSAYSASLKARFPKKLESMRDSDLILALTEVCFDEAEAREIESKMHIYFRKAHRTSPLLSTLTASVFRWCEHTCVEPADDS